MTGSTKNSIWRKGHHRIRTLWRRHVRGKWRDYQWGVLGGLWVVTLYLGYVGFAKHFAAFGGTRSPWDLFYLTLQLIPLQSGAVSAPIPWELEVARLLAPGVAAYTALQGLALVFYEELQLLRMQFVRDHLVICGLGRKGWPLTKGFLERGERVVVIEQDESNGLLGECREQGAIVLIGNATNQELLRQARVHKAQYLISVCGDDGANAEVAVHARDLVRGHDQVLTCFVHIVDPQLCNLLREQEIATEMVGSFRLEFFNVFDRGARALLNEYPAFSEAGTVQSCRPHVLVIGLGRMGQSLVVHAARDWWARHPASDERLRITIIDREAERKVESLRLQYPRLEKVCELVAQQMDIRWPEFQRARFLFDAQGQCDVTTVYVCLDNDSLGLAAGLTLLQRVRGQQIPIVVRMTQAAGLASLLHEVEGDGGSFANLHAFGLLDRICTPDLLLGGTHEILACAIHEDYVRHQEKLGQTPETNPSMVPWDELPESLKESNRRQADHIGLKLKAVGCGIAPLTDWDAERFEFTPEEVEQMAMMEHQRFVEERVRAGWTYIPGQKDLEGKISPDLIPWDELPEPEKEKNRNTVRGLPVFLARAGFQIYRL